MKKVKRNDPCPCGSGKKYKKCCLLKESSDHSSSRVENARGRERLSPGHFRLQWMTHSKISDKLTLIGMVHVQKDGLELRPAIRIVHFDSGDKKKNDTVISAATNMFDSDTVLVSDAFNRLPDLLKETTIWHEIGHFYHDHFDRHQSAKQREDYIIDGKVHPRELEADEFAIAKVGKEALGAILRFMLERDCYDSVTKNEFEMRLTHLTNP